MDKEINVLKQEESIKLMKMSKGFQWEVKLIRYIDDERLKRLKEINDNLEMEYTE